MTPATWYASLGGFILVAMTIGILVLASRWPARDGGSRVATFGQAVDRVIALPGGRFVLLAAWWWIGWHFLAR